MEALLDIRDLAAVLKISKSQAESLLSKKALPAPIRIGNLRRWSRNQVQDWIAQQTPGTQSTPGLTPAAPTPPPPRPRGRPRRVIMG